MQYNSFPLEFHQDGEGRHRVASIGVSVCFHALSHLFCGNMNAHTLMSHTSSLEHRTLTQTSVRAVNRGFWQKTEHKGVCLSTEVQSTLSAAVPLLHKCLDQYGQMETVLCSASAANFLYYQQRYSRETIIYVWQIQHIVLC